MKKLVVSLFVAIIVAIVAAPERSADAQPVFVGYCCDSWGARRCFINPTPLGNQCYCYGLGWGWACF